MDWILAQEVIETGDALTESFSLLQAVQVVVAVVGAVGGVGYAAYRQAKKRADDFIGTYIDRASDNAINTFNGSLDGMAQSSQQQTIVDALTEIKAHFGIVPDPDPVLVTQIRMIVSEAVQAEIAAISAK